MRKNKRRYKMETVVIFLFILVIVLIYIFFIGLADIAKREDKYREKLEKIIMEEL
jgi:hypothetical protein